MRRRMVQLAALGAVALGLSAFAFGGWAVITVEDLPEHLVVGQPTKITFVVRQHGRTPLGGLHATGAAKRRGDDTTLRVDATPTPTVGRYTATVTVPRSGEWVLTVNS